MIVNLILGGCAVLLAIVVFATGVLMGYGSGYDDGYTDSINDSSEEVLGGGYDW